MLYPAVGFVARFDFHIEVFVIPALIAAFYMMEKGRWTAASLFLIFPLLCKENMGFTVLAFGVYAMLRWKKYKWGIAWIVIGLIYTWFTIFWLIPTVRGETVDTLSRYAWLGESTPDKLQTLIFDPAVWFTICLPKAILCTRCNCCCRSVFSLFLDFGNCYWRCQLWRLIC